MQLPGREKKLCIEYSYGQDNWAPGDKMENSK